MPTQNVAIDWPASTPSIARRSQREPRRTAERMPTGMPTSTAISMPATASSTVAGSRSSTRAIAGLPSTIERPRSPRAMLPR